MGLLCALVANLLHNNGRFDPAVVPAIAFWTIHRRWPRTWSLWTAAIAIALPSALFVRPSALTHPGIERVFLNHLALLLAALFAVASLVAHLLSARQNRA